MAGNAFVTVVTIATGFDKDAEHKKTPFSSFKPRLSDFTKDINL